MTADTPAAAPITAAPMDSYSPEDRAFYLFWYGHMLNDLMQPPLAGVSHATARYIWNAALSYPVAAQPAASGVEAQWVRDALQELAHRIKSDGLDIFDGPETPQMVRDAIEWFAAELSVSDLSTALTGAAKDVK